MEFETIKPTQRTLTFLSDAFECFVLFLPFYVTATNGSRINKRNTCTFAQTHHFHKDCQWNTNLSLQLYKTVIRNSSRKISLHMLLNVKQIKAFQVFERCTMKQNQNCHYFALRHCKLTVSFICLFA